ncbi:MAG: histidine kinase dimerization/phosphoacceptor domain -containing protein [Balneolales bacterium]
MPKQENLDLSKENLIESLIKSMPGLFVLFDQDGRIHWWNKRLEHYSGYSEEQIKDMKVLELVDEHNKGFLNRKIEETFQKGEATAEIRINTSSEGALLILLTGVSLELQGGKFIIASGIDITSKEQERLKKIIDEKNTLLEEVHHRIKNNLSVVSSLLSMQGDQAKDEQVKKLLQESVTRVKSMSMVHQMLYEQEDFSKINFQPYVKKLVEHLALMYKTKNTSIETEVDDHIYFDLQNGVPCALIIHELTSNAFKHGCKGQEKCKIKISLTREQGVNTLTVYDNGTGSFDLKKKKGLGMTLIQGLASQLKGKLDVQKNGGTSFIVTFKT